MKLAVLGAGSWGLTLASMLENNFDDICVWGRKEDFTPEFMETKKKINGYLWIYRFYYC